MAINNFNAKNGLSVGSNPINIVDNTANATFATAMTTGSMGVGTPVVATSRLFVSGTSTSSDTTLVVRAGVPSPSGKLLDIRNNSGASVASIDYLGNIFGVSGSFSGDITITGNLTVAGTQTIVNSEVVNIKDNIVLLNANPSPAATGGIYVADTTVNTTGSLIWDSSVDQWKAGKSGLEITLVSGSGTNNYVTKWVGSNSVGDSIVFDNGTNVGIGTTLLDSKLVVAGNAVISGSVNPSADNTGYALGTSAKRWSNVVATSLSGSLTKLSDGTTDYLQAGSNIAITTGSNGSVTIATTGLASTSAQYLTLTADASLSSERVFTPSTGLKFVDGGAGGNYTLSINDNIVATVSGTTFTGVTNHNAGLSGSLTRLTDGTSYIIAGGNMTVLTGSNGALTFATINSGTIHGVTAGNGLLGGGTSGVVSLEINNSIVATVSGTTFTGVTKHNAGLSGSLTKLTDGTSYLIAGNNIQITTGSTGAVTVANTATGATYVAGANTQVQFNDGGTFGADGDFTFDKNNNLLRVTNISGSLTGSNVLAGQVVLAGTGGVLSGSNNFWWDNSTGNVGIGTSNSNGNRLAISGGNLSVTGSVLPGASTTYDLGSATYRWRDLYARTGSFSGDVTITGDLIVNGTQFIVNTQVVEIEDNAILLNAGPSPASSGGIYVADTTTGITGSLLWDSTTDLWKAGKLGLEVSLVSGSGTNNYLTKWVGSNAVGTSVVTDNGTNVGVGMTPTTDKLSVNGSMSVTGSLLPGVDNTYDLGSSTKRWKLIQAVNISGSLTGSNVLAGQVIVAGTGGVLSGSNNFTYNNSDLAISGTLRSVYSVGDEGGELFFTKPQTNTTLNDGVTIDLYRNKIRIFEAGGTNRGGYFDVSTLAAGAGTNLVPLPAGSDTQVQFNDGGAFGANSGLTYNKTTNALTGTYVVAATGFSGSLTRLTDGTSYVIAGGNMSVVTGSNGAITLATINSGTIHGVTANNGLLGGGTSGTVALSIDNNVVATVSGTTFTGGISAPTATFTHLTGTYVLATSGISGSLTKLSNGTSYLIGGSNISITTGSSGAVTISAVDLAPLASSYITVGNDSTLPNERSLTAGNGLKSLDGGAGSSYTLSINDSIVATVSGTTFTGATRHNAGLSGSLTQLVNGTSYLIAGTNVQITTGSTGAVTIANTATGATYVAGSNTQVQFNDGGTFGADGDFTFDKVNNLLQVTNISGSLTGSNVLAGHVVVAGTGGLISGSNNFWWDNAGTRVGIGTSSFTARLHVSGSSTSANPTATLRAGVSLPSAGILDVQTYTGTSILDVYETSIDSTIPYRGGNGSATAPTFAFTTSTTTGMYRRTTGQLLNFTVGGSQAFGVDSSGNVAIGVSPTAGSSGRLHIAGDAAAGSTPTLLVRHGAANGANLPVLDVQNSVNTSLLFVSGSGNVGIGTTTPLVRAHLYSINVPGRGQLMVDSPSGDLSQITFYSTGTTQLARMYATASATVIGSTLATPMTLETNAVERVRIDSTGNVGIGTAAFTDKLAVNGSMSVTGSLLPGVDDTYDLGSSTKRWANVNAEVVVSSGSFAPAYSVASSTSGTTALFDTISVTTNAAVYELMIIGNPNSSASAAYRDVIYGKVIIGTGNNGAAVRNYIQFIVESPAPRSLYGAAGNGPLTADVVYLQAGNEFTDIAQGGTATIRVKIAGYTAGFVGNNTTVRLKQLA